MWCKLPPHIHEYFFRHVLAGEHTAKQVLIEYFFKCLYNECLKRKLPPTWDKESAGKVFAIALKLNFKDA